MNDDQPSRLNADFMAGVLSGYLMGNEAGYQRAQDDMAEHWARVAHTIHANAGQESHSTHEQAVRARQVEARQRHQAEAMPWPDEANPP